MLGYYGRHRAAALVGALSVVASALLGLAVPGVVRRAVDTLSAHQPLAAVGHDALALLALTAGAGVFLFLQRRLLVGVSRHLEHHLRVDLYEHVLRLPPSFFMRQRIGDLLTRAVSDVGTVRMAVGPALMYTINTVTVIVVATFLMARISPMLTGISLAIVPLVALVTRSFGTRIHHRWGRTQEALSTYTARLQEHLVGLRVLRAYTCEGSEMRTLAARNDEYVAASERLINLQAVFHPLLQTVIGLSFVAVLAIGGSAVRGGTMTLGQFVEFNLYLVRMIWPMIALGWVVNLVQRGAASMSRVEAIFEHPPLPEIARTGAAPPVPGTPAGVVLRDVTFAYPDAPAPALRRVSFAVAPGSRLAVVGGVGSGKSTLLSLIPRLLEVEPGHVLLDGHDIRSLSLASLRSQVALVPQGSFLFSTTLRENIALARPDAGDEAVLAALVAAGLEEDLATLPRGLDTVIGERGITLSGGQRQRVAIARALLVKPRLLLLDDCLSAVDTRTERIILDHLPDTTLVLATHRLAAAELCDQVVVLEDGEVIESGSPTELAAAGGTYARLLSLQRLEQDPGWSERSA